MNLDVTIHAPSTDEPNIPSSRHRRRSEILGGLQSDWMILNPQLCVTLLAQKRRRCHEQAIAV